MLYDMPIPEHQRAGSSTGIGKLCGASGNVKPANENTIAGIQIARPTPTAFWNRGVRARRRGADSESAHHNARGERGHARLRAM